MITASEQSDLQKQETIANFCGWKNAGNIAGVETWQSSDGWLSSRDKLPDYLHDHNAIREAEKHLTEDEWYVYIDSLIGKKWTEVWEFPDVLKVRHNTPAQCAEALLKIIQNRPPNRL